MRLSIGDINIICTSITASLRFYRDVLGFSVVEAEGPFARLSCGDRHVQLLAVADAGAQAHRYSTVPTMSFDVLCDDLGQTRRHLEGLGATVLSDPAPSDRRFFVADPDGLVVEIIGRSGA